MSDSKFTDLEIQLAYQEDTINTLNETVYKQQLKLDKLEKICDHLVKKVGAISGQIKVDEENSETFLDPEQEIPPHY